MPGFNGMGPQGLGPMTGRGRGYCMFNTASGINFVPGFGFGRARGKGWRNCYYATGLPGWARFAQGTASGGAASSLLSGEEELNLLKEQAFRMESALERTKKRIKELEDKK
jgi:hypothetical protein